jgi:hypothetical protein
VIGGKSIAVSRISDGDAVNSLVALYDIHGRGRRRDAIFLFCPGDQTRLRLIIIISFEELDDLKFRSSIAPRLVRSAFDRRI